MIRYWRPEDLNIIHYCTTAKFFEHNTKLPDGEISTESQLSTSTTTPPTNPTTIINIDDHPLLQSPPRIFQLSFPTTGSTISTTDIKDYKYHTMPILFLLQMDIFSTL